VDKLVDISESTPIRTLYTPSKNKLTKKDLTKIG
ncbi:hypothetical protein LCGC14_1624920, partial [marine sediment metagenome]